MIAVLEQVICEHIDFGEVEVIEQLLANGLRFLVVKHPYGHHHTEDAAGGRCGNVRLSISTALVVAMIGSPCWP